MDMTQTDLPGASAIDSYMGRVDAAARGMPPDRQIELLDQLREHLDAVSQSPGANEASVFAAIDRLGDPAAIVASEDDLATPTRAVVVQTRSAWGPLEIVAILLLIVGAFALPFIGPPAGLVCVWLSPAWTRGEKWIATALGSGAVLLIGSFVLIAIFGNL